MRNKNFGHLTLNQMNKVLNSTVFLLIAPVLLSNRGELESVQIHQQEYVLKIANY
jgi:hypothetical protein